MDFKKQIETAWKLTLQYITPLLLMTLVMFILSGLTMGILAPVLMAGYMQSILLLIRQEREPKIQDIFSHMNLFLPLLGFSILIAIAIVIGLLLLIIPGVILIALLSFGCVYMLPLMTEYGFGVFDAAKKSFKMSLEDNIIDHLVIVLIFYGIISVGSSVVIGVIFAQPLATLFLLLTYEEKKSRRHIFPENTDTPLNQKRE